MLDIDSCSHFSDFLLYVILIMSTIYFRVITKDFAFPLSGGYVVTFGKTISKVFDIFLCSNKSQIMSIKILKLQYASSLEKNQYLLDWSFSTLIIQNCQPPYI